MTDGRTLYFAVTEVIMRRSPGDPNALLKLRFILMESAEPQEGLERTLTSHPSSVHHQTFCLFLGHELHNEHSDWA